MNTQKLVFLLAVAAMNGGFGAGDQKGCANGASNYTFIERAVERVKKDVMVYRLEIYKSSCGFLEEVLDLIINKCKKKTRIARIYEPMYYYIINTTNVTKCCIGFITENGTCVRACGPHEYGVDCKETCTCNLKGSHGAKCDDITGRCHCREGYSGANCQHYVEVCPFGHYGSNCRNICMCQNNSTCDAATGTCNCSATPGWVGSFCEKGCGPHEYGVDCKETCTCNLKGSHGAKCDDITGRCHCREGYSGANCQHYVEVCPFGHYGSNCRNICMCQNNSTCDAATGTCNCSATPGWVGSFCEKACGPHEYGVDCKETCTCNLKGSHGAKCDDITGRCHCREGYSGANCQHYVEVCPFGHYGSNCRNICMCQNNSTCDAATGTCNCSATPGWVGSFCEKACGPHEYGVDCKETCTCNLKGSHGAKCDDITGRCHCREGYSGANCQHYVEAEANHPDNTVKSNTFPTDARTGVVIGAVIVLGAAVVIAVLVTRRLLRREGQGHNDEREKTNPGVAATQPEPYEALNIASMEERDRRDANTVLLTTLQSGVPDSDCYETIPN
ncbi:multiple epidermal growth factor-like domains protein 10 isoform X2 [Mya arenaria]|uniref:multiple epidermal growth factor-like domains protein 10 isoform X2 n=1 Tax=Mya arenaria TaxID=6604 RepID=UPI0022E65600|nr:multiple epidermal growth factor-like domains protein 10 isoform X2 [Mya arenaria]